MFAMLMGLRSITPKELHDHMQSDAITVIDVNAEHAWIKAHVPGAINLGVDFDAGALPPDRSASVVFYCSNPLCTKAPRAARRAKQLGYTDILVMLAGIAGWTNARLPVEATTSPALKRT